MARPTKKFQCGGISVAIWENEIKTENGPKPVLRTTVERRYKDDATGEWKSTGSFAENDLPRVILALQKAYDFVAFKKQRDGTEEVDGPEWPIPPEVSQ